jgi:hypothetical protein
MFLLYDLERQKPFDTTVRTIRKLHGALDTVRGGHRSCERCVPFTHWCGGVVGPLVVASRLFTASACISLLVSLQPTAPDSRHHSCGCCRGAAREGEPRTAWCNGAHHASCRHVRGRQHRVGAFPTTVHSPCWLHLRAAPHPHSLACPRLVQGLLEHVEKLQEGVDRVSAAHYIDTKLVGVPPPCCCAHFTTLHGVPSVVHVLRKSEPLPRPHRRCCRAPSRSSL